MRPTLSFSVRPQRVFAALIAIIVAIVCCSMLGQYSAHYLGHGRLLGFVSGFNVDAEGNVPAHFSALMLLSISILAGLIGCLVRREKGRFYKHWWVLAVLFVGLAADEFNSFHERLDGPMASLVDAEGVFHFTWVVAGMAVVAIFVIGYARFFWHLSWRWKKLFAASGVTYVAGAVGVELLAGWYVSPYTPETFTTAASYTYSLIATLEEALEMLGVATCIYAMLEYLRVRAGKMWISFDSTEDGSVLSSTESSSYNGVVLPHVRRSRENVPGSS